MNKIDIILIYLIIIISFVCIIKIYLNNKKIERFYSFNKEFSGVMKFIDKIDDTHLGSFPADYERCFLSSDKKCIINDIEHEYNEIAREIRFKDTDDSDEIIKVSNIRLPKGDTGEDGSDARNPTIKFYYKDTEGRLINEDESGETTITPEESHIPFHTHPGDECMGIDCDTVKVIVTRHNNCEPKICDTCQGITNIDKITASTDNSTAITVEGDITTNNIILEQGGEICINKNGDTECLTYNDIEKLIQWSDEVST